MTIKFRIITRNVKSVKCDKCGHKVNHSFTRVCKSCYKDKIDNKRISDFRFRDCFLGSRQDHYDKCRLCGEGLGKEDSIELFDSCFNSFHPDSSHQGWGHEKPARNSAYPCRTCGGIQIIEAGKDSLQYFYYKIGSTRRTGQPYICESNLSFNEKIEKLATRSKCIHEYIEVLSTAISGDRKNEADKLYKKLCKINNLGWLLEREDARDSYERQAYGETHLWCWKCGAYYVPTGKLSFVPPAIGWGEKTS